MVLLLEDEVRGVGHAYWEHTVSLIGFYQPLRESLTGEDRLGDLLLAIAEEEELKTKVKLAICISGIGAR